MAQTVYKDGGEEKEMGERGRQRDWTGFKICLTKQYMHDCTFVLYMFSSGNFLGRARFFGIFGPSLFQYQNIL